MKTVANPLPAARAKTPRPLRIGFLPLSDCAPLVMAQELGLFARHGLRVQLRREIGWAAIRDKVIAGELDAAHALAPMPFAATLGLGSACCPCVTGLVLNLHGNAITLSTALWARGVRDAVTFKREIERTRRQRTYTLGVVFQYSSHMFLLRQWLLSGGIDPDRDVRLVVVPPPSMFSCLKSGLLDGYCVGEPWNSLAVQAGIGWCPAISAQLATGHPEKVLMVRQAFAEGRSAEHLRLLAALLEACAFCDRPENREQIIATLARPEYVNARPAVLRGGWSESFDLGQGRVTEAPNFNVFHRYDANEPSAEKAAWVGNQLVALGAVNERLLARQAPAWDVFRTDLFDQARQLLSPTADLPSNHEIVSASHLHEQADCELA